MVQTPANHMVQTLGMPKTIKVKSRLIAVFSPFPQTNIGTSKGLDPKWCFFFMAWSGSIILCPKLSGFSNASTLQITRLSPCFCVGSFSPKMFRAKKDNLHDLVDWSDRPRLLGWCESKRRCHPWAMRPSHLHTTLFCFQAHEPFCLPN